MLTSSQVLPTCHPLLWQQSQWRAITQFEQTGLCNTEKLPAVTDNNFHKKSSGFQNVSQMASVSKECSQQKHGEKDGFVFYRCIPLSLKWEWWCIFRERKLMSLSLGFTAVFAFQTFIPHLQHVKLLLQVDKESCQRWRCHKGETL